MEAALADVDSVALTNSTCLDSFGAFQELAVGLVAVEQTQHREVWGILLLLVVGEQMAFLEE